MTAQKLFLQDFNSEPGSCNLRPIIPDVWDEVRVPETVLQPILLSLNTHLFCADSDLETHEIPYRIFKEPMKKEVWGLLGFCG